MSHTPGPWEHSDMHIFALTDEHDEVICRADGVQDWRVTPDPERAAANIRLMAAAPELLAALKSLEFAARVRENIMGDPCSYIAARDEVEQALRNARAVIAKAEGE